MNINQLQFNPGYFATFFTILFLASLIPVTLIFSEVHFPAPTQSSEEIISYFKSEIDKVQVTAFFQFCSAIVLGIFTTLMVNRMRFLGIKTTGVSLAFFSGLLASTFVATSALIQWTLVQPDITTNGGVILALYQLLFIFGGPGYSVPIGIFIAGISFSAWYKGALPKWLIVFGIFIGVIGILSVFDLITHKALPLIPLTRFPGFIWMIAAGFVIQET